MDFDKIFELAKQKGPKRLVVACGESGEFFEPILEAKYMGLVSPILLGGGNFNIKDKEVEYIHEPDLGKARARAINMVKEGEAEIFMEAATLSRSLFELFGEKKIGVKKRGILSHIFLFESLKDGRMTMFTDTYINDYPDIKDKVDIVENAIEVVRILGIDTPKIAALAALEQVNPALISTIDAAALSKMSERGQFGTAIVEGPLAMDNAESASAARHKGIDSSVPGDVDIYLFPDIESAYLTTQFLFILGNVPHAGILGGINIPIVILTPLDTKSSCLFNIALAVLQ